MIKKIISGGQTGADRAALDTAIKFNIDHGGWVPLGRIAEDGVVPEKYDVKEMPTNSYPKRTEQNVLDSQATLIVTRGDLTGGSLLTRKLAIKHGKPCLHIDLFVMDEFEAAILLNSFITDNGVEILNVAGSRESISPGIYRSVKGVLETVFYMQFMETPHSYASGNDLLLMDRETHTRAQTVDAAVNFLAKEIPLRTRSLIANTDSSAIGSLYFSAADFIKVKLGLDDGNTRLIDDCCRLAGVETMDAEDVAMVILKALKTFLEKDHVLRVVK
ncbi:MAG: putative molybdenum carrier protein [Pseudomonadota bacterium]